MKSLVKRLSESFFGEAKKITAAELTPELIKKISKEMEEYIKDWPTEAFNIDLKINSEEGDSETSNFDVEAFEILDVHGFINDIADTMNLEIDEEAITKDVIEQLFSFLDKMTVNVKMKHKVNFYKVIASWSDDDHGSDSETEDWDDIVEIEFEAKLGKHVYVEKEYRIDFPKVDIKKIYV